MAWWNRKEPSEADRLAHTTALAPGDKVLGAALDVITGRTVVATVYDLVVLSGEGEVSRRPWMLVDAGSWESDTGTTSVTWVDGTRGTQWTFGHEAHGFAEAFRDRVEASRVIDAPVLDGDHRVGRAAIRKNLQTGELVPQLIFDRRVRRDDPEMQALGQEVVDFLAEQVGL